MSIDYNFITGFDNNDTLVGTNSEDFIYGFYGDDILIGGAGNDVLFGGQGDDIMLGGDGADTFELTMANIDHPIEKDIIVDFDPNSGDVLWLQSWNSSNLNYTLEQKGDDTLITINSDSAYFGYDAVNEILLVGVQATDLTTDHYGFNNY